MANSRLTSMIIPPGVSDEINTNGSKHIIPKKEFESVRLSNQQKLPVDNLINVHSSSSSIDSAGAKNAILTATNSLPQMNSTTTISSTTTDSDLESEQDDNNSSESANLPIELKKQKLTRCDNKQQKNDVNNQEQLSRRVRHFRKLFKTEITDDMPELIDSYVCAYQGDILLQGKMYITDRYLCFHSRIISYVTKHVHRWEQIDNVTKERVAFIFPTAIGIQLKTTGKKVIYASFLQRDQAFEKILSICSHFNNDTNSLQDDDENHLTQGNTLKSINSNRNYNEKIKKSKHNMHYELSDGHEHDDVLQMCLRQDKTNNNNKRPTQSTSSKNSEDKQQQQQSTKKLVNSDKQKTLLKNSNIDQISSNDLNENNMVNNESIRNSRYSNNQQKQTDTTLRSSSVIYRQSRNTSLQNPSRDRTLSPTNRTLSNLSHSNSSTNFIPNINSSIINLNNDGLIKKYTRIIILSLISLIKILFEYLLLLYNQFKTYPIKTSFILLIFLSILTFHSFYLIKLAYRIENRLQSLHHKWPSSSMKNSLPTLKEL